MDIQRSFRNHRRCIPAIALKHQMRLEKLQFESAIKIQRLVKGPFKLKKV
jgi:hypothetical protein